MNDNKQTFAWNVHTYLSDFIKFGDTKAAVLCGLSGGLAVWISNLEEFYKEFALGITTIAGVLALIFFCSAFVLAMFAIWPNLTTFNTKRNKSNALSVSEKEVPTKQFVFWKNILAHVNQNTFSKELNDLTDEELTDQVANHCFELASVADKKYLKISWASRLFALGLISIGVFFISLKAQKYSGAGADTSAAVQQIDSKPK